MEMTDKKICERVFSLARKKEAEVLIFSKESALTRFADNVVSQNVANRTREIIIRVLDKGRMGRVSTSHAGEAELKAAVDSALAMLPLQKKDPELMPLAGPAGAPADSRELFDEETAGFSPSKKADKLLALAEACKSEGQLASGTLDNGWGRVTVANSKGIFSSHIESSASYDITVKDGDGMGWASEYKPKVTDLDFEAVGRRARDKARAAKASRSVKPGPYTVILEPNPVANILFYAGIYGFGGQFFQEGQSFISGKLGKKVLGSNITIEDNGVEGPSACMPFDFEGQPRRRVMLVEDGVAKSPVHDRKTARKGKTKTTGHALPMPNTYGPLPLSLTLKPGSSSVEEMIKSTKRGILVTQFHYVNLLKPLTLEITGMTRNGTFLVEDGEVAYPIKNLRFTESIVGALSRVEEIGREQTLTEAFFGGKFLVPPLKIRDFNFSSATEF